MIIRKAEIDDVASFVMLCREMHEQSALRDQNFIDYKVASIIEYSMLPDPRFCVFLVEYNGEIVGGMIGCVNETWYGDDLNACEVGMYVREEHRSYSVAKGLVRSFEEWAIDRGAKDIEIGSVANMVDKRYLTFLEHLGYKHTGFTTRKILKIQG